MVNSLGSLHYFKLTNMKKGINTLLLIVFFAACKKEIGKEPNSMISPSNGVLYTNKKNGIVLVQLIGAGKVYTGIMLPGNTGVRLDVPATLSSGRYDVVLSPEGSLIGAPIQYTIGGITGLVTQYPATIKNVFIPVDNSGAVAISVR